MLSIFSVIELIFQFSTTLLILQQNTDMENVFHYWRMISNLIQLYGLSVIFDIDSEPVSLASLYGCGF